MLIVNNHLIVYAKNLIEILEPKIKKNNNF